MNPLTTQLLDILWSGDPTFGEIRLRLKEECDSMSAAESAIIGRDFILRRHALYTKTFHLAAFLASNGIAGNDGFMDFTDCVAILPEDRYQRLLANPDDLIDDPVSANFGEYYFISEICKIFDLALTGEDDDDLLYYLILGDHEFDWNEINSGTETDAKTLLPRLHSRFGYLLKPSSIK